MQQQTCWNQIGVLGDQSCSTLTNVVHCQNCSVYRQAGRGLLERPIPEKYASEWTALLAETRNDNQTHLKNTVSINIFRLGQEWLALPSSVIKQILPPKPVHSIPHRSNPLLKGIVNVQGQLLLCISLCTLLGIEAEHPLPSVPTGIVQGHGKDNGNINLHTYLVVMERERNIWTFEVDQIHGLHRCSADHLRNAPALGSTPLNRFTQAIFSWNQNNVSYLDDGRVFAALYQEAL